MTITTPEGESMTIPTAIAPTVATATPRVERFAARLVSHFCGKLLRFYECDPCVHQVQDRQGNKWHEGSWGLHIAANSFSNATLDDARRLSKIVSIDGARVEAIPGHKVEIVLWLTARLLR